MNLNYSETLTISNTYPWPKELIDSLVPEVKVIYSDIDGTLFGPGGCLFKNAQHEFTSLPSLAILQCHLNNIDVVPVSGRSNKQLQSDSRILGFRNWISELGCQIAYNCGETILLNTGDILPSDFSVWESIHDSGAPSFLLSEFQGRLEYHDPWARGRECTHLFRGQINVSQANELLIDNGFGSLNIIDNGKVRRRSEALDASITEIRAYHLLPRASSKASAVEKDMVSRSLQTSQVIAIGDSEADLELANKVGALFLVRNALFDSPQLIEKIRDYDNVFITHEEMGLGWAEAVRFMIGHLL